MEVLFFISLIGFWKVFDQFDPCFHLISNISTSSETAALPALQGGKVLMLDLLADIFDGVMPTCTALFSEKFLKCLHSFTFCTAYIPTWHVCSTDKPNTAATSRHVQGQLIQKWILFEVERLPLCKWGQNLFIEHAHNWRDDNVPATLHILEADLLILTMFMEISSSYFDSAVTTWHLRFAIVHHASSYLKTFPWAL